MQRYDRPRSQGSSNGSDRLSATKFTESLTKIEKLLVIRQASDPNPLELRIGEKSEKIKDEA
ncbi:MAG: hypothetical protein HC780_17095 [Leptolyngbyaceae cyanobacterium CSU_1_3]|nr:hypothetical protein [Leptolyngbyaceae cyanobacterium CSU_1_3]